MNSIYLLIIHLVAVSYSQPLFSPMAATLAAGPALGVPLDTFGAASAFSGGMGMPLLSPLELNAIMEAQSGLGGGGGGYKSAFAPSDSEVTGFSGGFPGNFDEGFSNERENEFYEPPQRGEPVVPAGESGEDRPSSSSDQGPSENPRDSRGAYHKDSGEGEGPPEPAEHREPEEKGYREREPEGGYRGEEGGPSAYRSRGKGAYEDRGEPSGPPSGPPPEHYGSGSQEGLEGPPERPGPYESRGRSNEGGPHEGGHGGRQGGRNPRDDDYLGPGPDPEPFEARGRDNRGSRDRGMDEDDRSFERDHHGPPPYGPSGRYSHESERPGAYGRAGPRPNGPYFREPMSDEPPSGGFGARGGPGSSMNVNDFPGSSHRDMASRPVNADYSGYKVITG
ncbi:uncharacterized protein LOC141849363 [Brevipalpus obovatus]|uniref:uncharacterized protein LOC141849363 n=1 Tax=Brevipalpus obovatus TaxID=246614 RepID=UPI003D9EDFFC